MELKPASELKPTRARLASEMDEMDENQVPVLIGITVMFIVLCSITTSLRFAVKRGRKIPLEMDDYLCFLGYILFLGFGASIFLLAENNVGRHSVFLRSLPHAREANINIRNIIFAQQFLHLCTITTLKMSILLLYRRIFTRLVKWFNLLWWACVSMTVVYLGIYVILIPVQGYPCPIEGPGLDCPFAPPAKTFFAPGGAGNASMDLVILLLPVTIIWTLQMSKQNRSALVGVFLLGSAAVAVSFARVPYMQNYYTEPDPIYDQVRPVLFAFAEAGTAIICASLPVLRPLLSKDVYKTMFSKKGGSSYNPDWSRTEPSQPGSRKPSETSLMGGNMELKYQGNIVDIKREGLAC